MDAAHAVCLCVVVRDLPFCGSRALIFSVRADDILPLHAFVAALSCVFALCLTFNILPLLCTASLARDGALVRSISTRGAVDAGRGAEPAAVQEGRNFVGLPDVDAVADLPVPDVPDAVSTAPARTYVEIVRSTPNLSDQ